MINSIDLLSSSYDYQLPESLIAKEPVRPADSAKLLIYYKDKDEVIHTTFREFLRYIPKDTAIFLNDTRVIKARIFGEKETGGKVELLLDHHLGKNSYRVLIRGRVKRGTKLIFQKGLKAVVTELFSDGSRVVNFTKDKKDLEFNQLVEILEEIGHIPLPPYMQREDSINDEIDYQTLFAKHNGAVAAPTASLHFTPELLEEMKKRFATYYLTLHVGAGTFKPVESEEILKHPMHSESYNIPNSAVEILKSDKNILAIGTTVTRTIEYFARTGKTSGECNLFLHPKNPPQRVNYLLTNFHLPKSTLIMLVSAFIGREKTLQLYNEAISKNYRFYSYGDAMLIL